MPGALVEIKADDLRPVRDLLTRLRDRLRDLTPVMRAIGEDILASAQQSFIDQASPAGVPWELSWRAIFSSGQTLRDTGVLMNSLNVQAVTPESVTVGTNVIYSAVHQFGAQRGEFGSRAFKVRAHERTVAGQQSRVSEHWRTGVPMPWGDIPARPFLGWNQTIEEAVVRTVWDYLAQL